MLTIPALLKKLRKRLSFVVAHILARFARFFFSFFFSILDCLTRSSTQCFFSTPNRECFTKRSGKQLASCQHNTQHVTKKNLCRRLLNFLKSFTGPYSYLAIEYMLANFKQKIPNRLGCLYLMSTNSSGVKTFSHQRLIY